VSLADNSRCAEENLLFAREELACDIASILRGDEHSPEALAHLFIILREAIEDGLEEINRTRETLAAAVELTFTHSRAHAAALRLYLLSQEGRLKVEDEPVRLINAAIERSAARR
jgi:transcription initiation factor TFIIIB Brf1 subunit/transcription initiation factor TFIIB